MVIDQPEQVRTMALLSDIEMGAVALGVGDLDRSLDYYRRTIGLELLEHNGTQAVLGVPGRPLLELFGRPRGRRDSHQQAPPHIGLGQRRRSGRTR